MQGTFLGAKVVLSSEGYKALQHSIPKQKLGLEGQDELAIDLPAPSTRC